MKVLQISTNWGHGGPGGVEKDLYYQLKQDGDTCLIAYGRDSVPSEIPSIRIGNLFSVITHTLFSRLFDCSGFCSTIATRSLIKKIQLFNPDIIQIHSLLGYFIDVKTLFGFLKHCEKPIVWTIHDCWPVTGHCINFERIGCEKWIKGCYGCKLKSDYPKSWFFDFSKQNWRRKRMLFSNVPNLEIVCPSYWLKTVLNKSIFKKYKIHVIHNGIDRTIFKPVKSNIKEKYHINDKIVLLAVAGVWNEMKGEKLLYDIANKIDTKYVIVMIGKKSQKKFPKNIISIDRTSNIETLVEWYSSADIFINPTLGDNFPTVNIEALSCGLPVITNETGGSPEAVDKDCGLTVKSKTADEFVRKIEEGLSKGFSREKCVAASLKFDKELQYRKYIDVYKELLSNVEGSES